ncbi:MAG: amidohydrolase [Bryobacteraceae bacterium]
MRLLLTMALAAGAVAAADLAKKQEAVASIDRRAAALTTLSDEIWRYAETALRETRSSKALADYAETAGFRLERGVAGMPTAFVATYGSGTPVIGVLAEFDALPGISQKAQPTREALEAGAPGHGCGHNLFGVASLAGAIAVKELIAAGKLRGTVKLFGTPAEESVYGKTYMIRDGVFKGVDLMLVWHPDDETRADMQSTQALVDFAVEFRGRTAHAAADPWNGRSAVDALEAFTHGVNMLREHVRPGVRMHYTIQKGGDVPNVVPDFARLWCWARDSTRAGVDVVLGRLREIAEGAAKIAGVEHRFTVQTGCWERLVLEEAAKLLDANMRWIGPIRYTGEEQSFARAIQRATNVPEKGMNSTIHALEPQRPDPPGGSTDVGDVSWVIPTLHFSVATAPEAAPWHAWPVVASGGMSIGHKGMVYAAKTIAATAVDLFEDSATRQRIRNEFEKRKGAVVYKSYIPDGPPPLPRN